MPRRPEFPVPLLKRILRAAAASCAGVFMKLACRVSIEGREHIPASGAFILVGNHVNPLEAPLVSGALPRADVWVVISEHLLRRVVVRRILNAFYDVIWVNRMDGRGTLIGTGAAVLGAGKVVIIMPEGRYSWSGRLGRGDDGAALLALAAKTMLVPVATLGLEHVKTSLLRLRRPRVAVRFGAPFMLGSQAPSEATHIVMRSIARLLPPEKRGFYADAPDAPGGELTLR